MGYYTNYSLYVDDSVDDEDLLDKIDKEIGRMNIFDGGMQDGYYAYQKWYDYQDDMCALSYRFPGVLFTLAGSGEEDEDLWVCYFRDGKYQYEHAKIIYDDFDSNKLRLPENQNIFSHNRSYSYE